MEKDKSNPTINAGDMVAFPRGSSGGRLLDHYGIADGKDEVIHFTPVGDANPLTGNQQGIYKKEPITQVGATYSVKNHDDKTALPPEDIVKKAESMVGKERPYDLLAFNCETAASELRYGVGSSTQAQKSELDAFTPGDGLRDVSGFIH